MTASSQPAPETATPARAAAPAVRQPRLSPGLHALIWILLGILLAAAIIFAWPLMEILATERKGG